MNVIVCIKQVPEASELRMDEASGTIVREGVENITNPLDLYAVEAALRLTDAHGGEVTAVSMGPPSAERSLREAISMGCDRGVLLTHRAFAASDTHATAYVLSKAIAKLAPYDLVLTGTRAIDGDTGQVGPAIASFLDLPLATFTSGIAAVADRGITVERLIETGYEKLRLPMPCLLGVLKEISFPRLPTLRGKQRARSTKVPRWGAEALGVDRRLVGRSGSPTRVKKVARPKVARAGERIDVNKLGPREAARRVVDFLEKNNLLPTDGSENGA